MRDVLPCLQRQWQKRVFLTIKTFVMQNRFIATALLSAGIFLASCGAQKKLESANGQIQQLQETNTQLNSQVEDLKKQVSNLIEGNKAANAEFSRYKESCEETQARLTAVQSVLREQYESLQQVEAKLEEGLADFQDKGVDVYEKDGLIYVSMQDNLLYKSGSAKLGTEGKAALAALASALNDYPRLGVIVVGNTDDKQFKKGTDNWSLSTERANGVVRVLRDEYNVDPVRLTAAGKSKYAPIADNATEEGRAKNRRTDIILNPDLVRIWESVQK